MANEVKKIGHYTVQRVDSAGLVAVRDQCGHLVADFGSNGLGSPPTWTGEVPGAVLREAVEAFWREWIK